MKIRDKYCSVCGKKLEFKSTFAKYSNYDGKKLYRIRQVCPDKKWYNWHTVWSPGVGYILYYENGEVGEGL